MEWYSSGWVEFLLLPLLKLLLIVVVLESSSKDEGTEIVGRIDDDGDDDDGGGPTTIIVVGVGSPTSSDPWNDHDQRVVTVNMVVNITTNMMMRNLE